MTGSALGGRNRDVLSRSPKRGSAGRGSVSASSDLNSFLIPALRRTCQTQAPRPAARGLNASLTAADAAGATRPGRQDPPGRLPSSSSSRSSRSSSGKFPGNDQPSRLPSEFEMCLCCKLILLLSKVTRETTWCEGDGWMRRVCCGPLG